MKEKIRRSRERAGNDPTKRARKGPPPLLSQNVAAWDLFARMQTQVIVGMAGVVGFNYGSIPTLLQWFVPRDRHTEVFDKFQAIERLYLKSVREKHERKNPHIPSKTPRRRNGRGDREDR